MKEFSLRIIDVAAAVVWVACAAFWMDDALRGPGDARVGALVSAVVGALLTVIAWLSRRLDHLEDHVYTEGMRAGFGARDVVRLPEPRK